MESGIFFSRGWPPTNEASGLRYSEAHFMTGPLMFVVSVTTASGSSVGPMASMISRISLTGTSRMISCAPSTADRSPFTVVWAAFIFETADITLRSLDVMTTSVFRRLRAIRARPIDAPTGLTPMIVIRSNVLPPVDS